MPTIYDIAKIAGVSQTTVSKVFNNYTEVSQKTKDRVNQIAKDIGYVPNLTARSLKTKKNYLIGVVFSEDVGIGLEHQFFSVVLEAFRKAIGTFGYDTVFINKSVGNKRVGYLDHCKYRNIDGLFIITALRDDVDMEALMASDIKCVTTDVVFKNTPYVISDNHMGARLAVEYLYAKGHRKIVHLAGPEGIISADERCQGFIEAIRENQLDEEASIAIHSKMFKFPQAYDATLEFLNTASPDNLPTALFASADIMAIAAIKAITDYGLRVPQDISVIGFDDIELASYSSPALTTIAQNKEAIGVQVANTLHQLIVDPSSNRLPKRIPVSLIERDSVKTLIKKSYD